MSTRDAREAGGGSVEVAVIGSRLHVVGFGLAGARILIAEDDAAVRSAWRTLPPDVGVVLLTAAAAEVLEAERRAVDAPLTAVMPT